MKHKVSLFCIILYMATSKAQETDIVSTSAGRVRGLKVNAVNGKPLWTFRGIPFAQPPVGELRFSKPLPYPFQTEVIDATRQRASCIQNDERLSPNETISEDCLFLNIFVKDINGSPQIKKKVLVYIHGGAFFVGSSISFNPGSIVTDHDIIVVVIQYRIGALGFLTTKNQAAPGNYALWDQTLALKWVKKNIDAFGGDANDVTIVGESAGSVSVSLLTLSPETKGLFTKAYSASGVAMSIFTDYRNSDNIITSLAKSLSCWNKTGTLKLDANTSVEVIRCLRARPATDFARLTFSEISRPIYIPWADGEFIPRSPRDLIKDANYLESIGFYDRKYLYSVTNNEKSVLAGFLLGAKAIIDTNSSLTKVEAAQAWQAALSTSTKTTVYDVRGAEQATDEIIGKAQQWYSNRLFTPNDVFELQADVTFFIPAFDLLNTIAKSGRTSSWLLYFNHYPKYITGDFKGTPHGMDLSYWFDADEESLRRRSLDKFDEDDINLKKVFSSVVANFVKVGNPESPLLNLGSCRWGSDGSHYLNFNLKPTVERNLRFEQRQLWMQGVSETCEHEIEDRSGVNTSSYTIMSFMTLKIIFLTYFFLI